VQKKVGVHATLPFLSAKKNLVGGGRGGKNLPVTLTKKGKKDRSFFYNLGRSTMKEREGGPFIGPEETRTALPYNLHLQKKGGGGRGEKRSIDTFNFIEKEKKRNFSYYQKKNKGKRPILRGRARGRGGKGGRRKSLHTLKEQKTYKRRPIDHLRTLKENDGARGRRGLTPYF